MCARDDCRPTGPAQLVLGTEEWGRRAWVGNNDGLVIECAAHGANDPRRLDRPGKFRSLALDLSPIPSPLLLQLGHTRLIAGADGARTSDRFEKCGEGQFGVTEEPDDERIVIPYFERLDVDLDHPRGVAGGRQRPVARRR